MIYVFHTFTWHEIPGVLCGCLLGMGNLFFLDLTKVERQKKQAESWTSCGRGPALGPIWIQCHISNHRNEKKKPGLLRVDHPGGHFLTNEIYES